jgi:hypothetical protein
VNHSTRRSEDVRSRAAAELRELISSDGRDQPGQDAALSVGTGKVAQDVYRRIFELVNSNDSNDKLAGVKAMGKRRMLQEYSSSGY